MVFCSVASGLASLVISAATFAMQEPVAPAVAAASGTAPAAAEVSAAEVSAAAAAPAAGAPATSSAAGEKPAAAAKKAQPDPPGWVQFLPLAFIGIMFYMILLRPQQKEQRRRQETLGSLKKSDKVVTTGGIVGTIADLSQDGRFVTLKVDDSTRIRFLRSAIHGLLDDKAEGSGS